MKNLLPFCIFASYILLAVSCSNEPDQPQTPGTLKITTSVNTGVDEQFAGTRATSTDPSQYTVILSGPSGQVTMPFPASGEIPSLQPGNYTVTLTSHENNFTTPAFDEQWYMGTTTVTVNAGSTAVASITCTQANAGVFFNYDPSLAEAGLENIIPTVTHQHGALEYSEPNREAFGYFATGQLILSLMNNGNVVPIENQDKQTLTVAERELWKVTLRADAASGGITVTVQVEQVTNPTNEHTWQVEIPENRYPFNDLDYVQLQQATVGTGVNLVFMGEGYTESEINTDRKYEEHIREAVEDFFSIYPYDAYRQHFNVWMVVGISNYSGITEGNGSMRDTRFRCRIPSTQSTEIQCDEDLIREAVLAIPGLPDIEELSAIVVINSTRYAGTCYMDDGFSISLCPRSNETQPNYNKRALVIHEAGGHGFAKLIDEYIYYYSYLPDYLRVYIIEEQTKGKLMNIDFTSNTSQILWKDFFAYDKYTGSSISPIGAYQGCYMFAYGAWRPESNSCMNNNIDYYNAPSRWEIVRRIMSLGGIDFSFEQFVAADNPSTPTYSAIRTSVEEFIPLAPPVINGRRLQ